MIIFWAYIWSKYVAYLTLFSKELIFALILPVLTVFTGKKAGLNMQCNSVCSLTSLYSLGPTQYISILVCQLENMNNVWG